MKRQVLILACLLAGIMNSNAQIQTAILEQDNTLKTFYGENAFKEAYEAAKDGAVITLSTGNFSSVEIISKSIAIIGSGWSGDNITFIYSSAQDSHRNNSYYNFAIEANNVRIEGLKLSRSIYIGSSYNSSNVISNLQIKNCYIWEFYGYNWKYRNTTIDQSIINIFNTTGNSEYLCIKNSKIQSFNGNCFNNDVVYITNCFIPTWYYSVSGYSTSCPYAVYKNCILGSLIKNNSNYTTNNYYYEGYYTPINNGRGEFYNNVFYVYPYEYKLGDNSTYSEKNISYITDSLKARKPAFINLSNTITKDNVLMSFNDLFNTSKSWTDSTYIKADIKGDDGKPVGVFGGTGFSLYPNIPRIVESKIDSNTDEEGKLNVKVKVEINK